MRRIVVLLVIIAITAMVITLAAGTSFGKKACERKAGGAQAEA